MPLEALVTTALTVVLADVASKQLALRGAGASGPALDARVGTTLVLNEGLAWGATAGGYAAEISVALTVVVAALALRACRELAALDPGAPAVLGLLTGAGAANLIDLLLVSPPGVIDFLAVDLGGVAVAFNLADVAVGLGLGLCVRTGRRVLRAHRAARERPALSVW